MNPGDIYIIGKDVFVWNGKWEFLRVADREDRMTIKRLTDFCKGENLR